MKVISKIVWLWCLCVGLLLWWSCTEPEPTGGSKIKGNLAQRQGTVAVAGLRTSWSQAGFVVPILESGSKGTEVVSSGKVDISQEVAKGKAPYAATQRLLARGTNKNTVKKYGVLSSKSTSLLRSQRILAQISTGPCPKKEGDEWVLEGVFVQTDKRNGKATLRFGTTGVKANIVWEDGSKETKDLKLDKNSPLKVPNYAALFEQTLTAQIATLSEEDTKAAENEKAYTVSNNRILSIVTIQASSESKQNNVLKETERSSSLLISKGSQYHTKRYFDEFDDGALKGIHSTLTVLLTVSESKGEELRFTYLHQSATFDCKEKDTTDGKTSNEPVNDGGASEKTPEPKPDEKVDCSKYHFQKQGASFPTWFGGTDKDSICKPMYAKLNSPCKSNADCHNPCQVICCRTIFVELVACIEGRCGLKHTKKCAACSTEPQNCSLPDGYKAP
jgi:hypothetical protein